MELWHTLGELVAVLGQLFVQLFALGAHWVLLILWVAWWLFAVNWHKAWPVLRSGGWAPLVLLIVIVALTWSRLQPVSRAFLGAFTIPNFWWQLVYVAMLAVSALFCGWLQGVFHWAPAVVSLEPPAPGHGDHAAHH